MSTRSYICIEKEDGTYEGIYCHYDGYLQYNGAILLKHYNDRAKVEHLLSLGNLSSLAPKPDPDKDKPHSFDGQRQEDVVVAYGRDRGEENQESHTVTLEDFNADDSWIEFIYIYGLDDTWRYFERGESTDDLHDLASAFNDEDLGGVA